jgi:hypothetical protein
MSQQPLTEPPEFDLVRQIALIFPGVEEGTSFGTPAFRVNGKFLARLHPDGESLVMKIDMTERQFLMEMEPETFYITDHYLNWPSVLIRLSNVHPDALRRLFEQAWRNLAPKRLIKTYEKNA